MAVSLKCCSPKGIPIIVMQSKTPKKAWVIAIQMPPNISHITFIKIKRQPDALSCTRVSRPKGQIAREAILRVCNPKGIPIIVIKSTRLPMKYSMEIIIPPKISQTRFPSIFTNKECLFQDYIFVFRILNRICQDYLFGFLWFDVKIPFYKPVL